jgi:Pregnancy-associated plasma protein-A
LVLLITGVLAWWMLRLPSREQAELTAPPAELAPPPTPAASEPRAWRPRAVVEPAPGCTPEAHRRCLDGDAWWIDSCGVTYAKAQECGAALCQAGACEPPGSGCGDIPLPGRCEGDVAVVCTAGRPSQVDCAAAGLRCASTEEGPACRPVSPDACDPASEPPNCDGLALITCLEGERQRLDCSARGAICGRPPGGTAPAACLQLRPPVPQEACEDPCGCPSAPGDEVCDGLDNDRDGFVDESDPCLPVDLVFFVIVDDDGQSSHAPEDIDAELARLQRTFARDDDFGLELRLLDVVRVAEPAWLELDGDDLEAMVRSPTISRNRDEFYVPVVITDRIFVDGVPRPGLSTVPNGMCGGQRRVAGPQPLLGLVAVAKQRWDTTLAHELGHFFGLCHTHADHPQLVIPLDPGPAQAPAAEDARVCVEPCTLEGDGICDTPPDPGPGPCAVDPECLPSCADGSTPDPANLMGYYPECRTGFTLAQAQLMRRTLALRRGWQRCLVGDGCACEIGDRSCPEAMSCRRFQSSADGPYQRCVLDGPVVPGGECNISLECSVDAQCIGQPDGPSRCVRPCDDATPACRCEQADGVTHPICMEDLQLAEP